MTTCKACEYTSERSDYVAQDYDGHKYNTYLKCPSCNKILETEDIREVK